MELREVIGDDVPIVTINHMTPFHDKYESPYVIDFIKEMVKGTTMICNSYTAQKQWGFGEVIIHGMDPNEWWDLPKEPRCITVLSESGMNKAYRRRFLEAVREILKEMGIPFFWIGADIRSFPTFDMYREYIGRSLVSFTPTWQSPRPRARTEAMFSGCCIISTPYQDADTFIQDGVNGFLTSRETIQDPRVMDSPEAAAKLIKRLVIDEPELALKIGQAGKKTAMELFTLDKFEAQWVKLLEKLGVL